VSESIFLTQPMTQPVIYFLAWGRCAGQDIQHVFQVRFSGGEIDLFSQPVFV